MAEPTIMNSIRTLRIAQARYLTAVEKVNQLNAQVATASQEVRESEAEYNKARETHLKLVCGGK